MTGRDTFFRVISPDHLYAGAIVFGLFTVLVVSMIYLFLYIRKRRYRLKTRLNDTLDEWISNLLIADNPSEVYLPDSLSKQLNRKIIRQFLIDKLITAKKNITGASAANIDAAFKELGLINDSEHKMKSPIWYIKARGIYELYMMDQRDMAPDIMDYTNHSNKFVRREAQAAIIGFFGFRGLSFLDELTVPMLEWQQLKLLEQLQDVDVTDLDELPNWLQSDNIYVVQFALKLVEVYMRYETHDVVMTCLQSTHEKIRAQAIKALGKIPNDETSAILQRHYHKETETNQCLILNQFSYMGTETDYPFLSGILNQDNDTLKLAAARAIVKISDNGWSLLTPLNSGTDSIYQQVEKEMAA